MVKRELRLLNLVMDVLERPRLCLAAASQRQLRTQLLMVHRTILSLLRRGGSLIRFQYGVSTGICSDDQNRVENCLKLGVSATCLMTIHVSRGVSVNSVCSNIC